jgi:FtsZ-binding cell division protein ZapB
MEEQPIERTDAVNLDGASDITRGIIATLIDSDRKGLLEYGVTVDREDYTALDWLDEKYNELLDAAKYNRAARRDIEKLQRENESLRAERDDWREKWLDAATRITQLEKQLDAARAETRLLECRLIGERPF